MLGFVRGENTKNSHVRQPPNDPQTNTKTSACGAGTYSSVEGATTLSTCTTCGAGTYSGEAALVCDMCQAGTYSGVLGATSVTTCQGEFVSLGDPKLVWVGLFRGGLGRVGGVRGVWAGCGEIRFGPICSGGKHKNSHLCQTPNNPQTNAKTSGCEAGKYSPFEGATSESTCIECGAGTYSAAIAAAAESACQGENQLQQLQQIPPVIESNLSLNLTYHSSVQTPKMSLCISSTHTLRSPPRHSVPLEIFQPLTSCHSLLTMRPRQRPPSC